MKTPPINVDIIKGYYPRASKFSLPNGITNKWLTGASFTKAEVDYVKRHLSSRGLDVLDIKRSGVKDPLGSGRRLTVTLQPTKASPRSFGIYGCYQYPGHNKSAHTGNPIEKWLPKSALWVLRNG